MIFLLMGDVVWEQMEIFSVRSTSVLFWVIVFVKRPARLFFLLISTHSTVHAAARFLAITTSLIRPCSLNLISGSTEADKNKLAGCKSMSAAFNEMVAHLRRSGFVCFWGSWCRRSRLRSRRSFLPATAAFPMVESRFDRSRWPFRTWFPLSTSAI